MPFKSEKQKKWMYLNKPEMAKKWESESKKPPKKTPKAEKARVLKVKKI